MQESHGRGKTGGDAGQNLADCYFLTKNTSCGVKSFWKMWETHILKQVEQSIFQLNSANKYVIPLKHIKIRIW